MNRKSISLTCAALLGALAAASVAQAGTPAVNITGGEDFSASVWNLGFSFTANSNTEVVALGNWAGAAFPQDQQVGLWDSQGDLLASVYVTNSDTLVGTSRFAAITPVALVAGQTYVVGAEGGADYTGELPDSGVSFDPRISYVTDLYTYNGGANAPLVEPATTEDSPYGWFGANFELSVPEPATWSLMLMGVGALGASLRSRRRALTAQA
jgi:hypothetical protein